MNMEKIQLTGQNLGRVFSSRIGRKNAVHLCWYEAKLSNYTITNLDSIIDVCFQVNILYSLSIKVLNSLLFQLKTLNLFSLN
jgi:hypothetical protein